MGSNPALREARSFRRPARRPGPGGARRRGRRPPAASRWLAPAAVGTAALLAAACGPADREDGPPRPADDDAVPAVFSGEAVEWIDLTHPFDHSAVYWPTAEPFRLDTVAADSTDAGYWYAANAFSAAEHGGTHLDAPYHFARRGATVEEIPLGRLIGPAAVVDVSEAAAEDPDYRVRVDDLTAWEEEHGRLPDGAIVLLNTGWHERWPDREAYLGTSRTGEEAVPELSFPGLHPDAARWLVEEREPAAVGLDTPSIDHGPSSDFLSHRILYEADIPGIENVARLDRLPAEGAWVVALPMKISGGTGAPLRIAAAVPVEGTGGS